MVSSLMETPEHPCVFVLGGLKISDAFLMMETVLNSGVADLILTGGLVGQILLVAQGVQIGTGTWEFIEKSDYKKFITIAKEILAKFSNCVILPVDLAQVKDGCRQEKHVGEIPDEFNATDIGSATAELYRDAIMKARTVFANGPVGIFEDPESALGTRILLEAMGVTQGYTIVGGGDSITAVEHFHVADKINYLCTGGGALIRFLTGEILPVVRALRYAATAFPGNKYI